VPWVPRARESASGTRSLNLNAELLEPKSLSQEPMASAIGGVGKRFARSRSAKSVALDDVLPAVSASGHYFFGSSLPSRSGPISACGTGETISWPGGLSACWGEADGLAQVQDRRP